MEKILGFVVYTLFIYVLGGLTWGYCKKVVKGIFS